MRRKVHAVVLVAWLAIGWCVGAQANREACRTLEVWNQALAAYDHNDLGLRLRYPPFGHFDAHSHWNGILDWKTFVAAYAKDGSPEHMYRFLVARLEELRRRGPPSPRLTPVADALLSDRCMERRVARPNLDDSGPRRRVGDYDFETTLQAVLTATPYTEFDSAYYVRGLVADAIAERSALAEKHLNTKITLDQEIGFLTAALRNQGILYSEQFVSQNRIASLGASHQRALVDAGVVLFAQFVNVLIAESDGKTVLKAKAANDGRFRCVGEPGGGLLEKQRALLAQLPSLIEGNRLVRGVDILAPEKTCIGTKGKQNLEALAATLYESAKDNRRRLVLHVHIGEGYPLFSEDRLAHAKSAAAAQCDLNLEPLTPLLDSRGVPLHYGSARENVREVIAAIEEFRRRGPSDFDEWVKIRFGHVTHIDDATAKRIAGAKVEVDVDLTSNLVTGALTTVLPGNRSMSSCTTSAYRRALEEAMESHSLTTLLDADVRVVLGTDGAGVEHSSFLYEYKWVAVVTDRHVARRQGKSDPDPGAGLQNPAEVNAVLADIQRYSNEHVCWMREDEGWRMKDGICQSP